MKLNPNCDFTNFMNTVYQCCDDVFFETAEGDVLNLKSDLCRYVFAVVVSKPHLLEHGTLRCKNAADACLLKEYLL